MERENRTGSVPIDPFQSHGFEGGCRTRNPRDRWTSMDDGAATPPRASCSHTCASPPMPIRGCAHVRSKPSMPPTPTATPPPAIGEEESPRKRATVLDGCGAFLLDGRGRCWTRRTFDSLARSSAATSPIRDGSAHHHQEGQGQGKGDEAAHGVRGGRTRPTAFPRVGKRSKLTDGWDGRACETEDWTTLERPRW